MLLISHRGNVVGKNPERENSPSYILEALRGGYDVEIDLWKIDDKVYLGHDTPQYEYNLNFFAGYEVKLWHHAKNYDVFRYLLDCCVNCFYHTNEDWVLTSKGYIWAYPGKEKPRAICVLPELYNLNKNDIKKIGCIGICSDEIEKWRI